MDKSTFGLHAAIVVMVALLAAVWLATKPGDHSAMNLFIGGLVSGYLKLAYDADQAKNLAAKAAANSEQNRIATQEATAELIEVKGKVFEVSKNVDGKLEKLLLATGAQRHAEGKLEEAAEERGRQLAATTLSASIPTPANPLLTEDKAKELMENQKPPVVIANKGAGWSAPTEPDVLLKQKQGDATL